MAWQVIGNQSGTCSTVLHHKAWQNQVQGYAAGVGQQAGWGKRLRKTLFPTPPKGKAIRQSVLSICPGLSKYMGVQAGGSVPPPILKENHGVPAWNGKADRHSTLGKQYIWLRQVPGKGSKRARQPVPTGRWGRGQAAGRCSVWQVAGKQHVNYGDGGMVCLQNNVPCLVKLSSGV